MILLQNVLEENEFSGDRVQIFGKYARSDTEISGAKTEDTTFLTYVWVLLIASHEKSNIDIVFHILTGIGQNFDVDFQWEYAGIRLHFDVNFQWKRWKKYFRLDFN